MRNIGLLDRLISILAHKTILGLLVLITLFVTQNKISMDSRHSLLGDTFKVEFTTFSPAFAAFEDDFLFDEAPVQLSLLAGKNSTLFKQLQTDQSQHATKVAVTEATASQKTESEKNNFLQQFDGSQSLSAPRSKGFVASLSGLKVLKPTKKTRQKEHQEEELTFGLLATLVASPQTAAPGVASQVKRPFAKKRKNSKSSNTKKDFEEKADKEVSEAADQYIVSGNVELTEGVAFLGSMEASWVVGDYELQVGSINVPDATYEIEVSRLVGDVIISLYDSSDELIGEGVLSLGDAKINGDKIKANIKVYPIDWDYAGQVIDAGSVGSGVKKSVEGVEIALYAFNDATKTSGDGSFSFYNWKKTNSRTLAIASKEGFKDSIFMLDSKTAADVLLFKDSYMDSYFEYLNELGIYDVKNQGTIYGRIDGIDKKDGYEVKLENSQTIYFLNIGFANTDQNVTSQNGLFSFVGLQDGDYELLIEKDGEIIDSRIVVVEQGKVSPVLVDLQTVSKHIEFFDPMTPDRKIDKVEVSFFDGTSQQELDADNLLKHNVNRGHDVSLMEFASVTDVNRTFISRHKGLQKVPLLNDNKLAQLAEDSGFTLEDGLIFGFVNSELSYQVGMVEEAVEKVIYFNQNGDSIKPEEEIPHGFILAGFPEGLSSIFVESMDGETILGTDLVFSNHRSISVTHLEVLTPE